MPHQPEDSITGDILSYLREQESVCIQTERQFGPGWIREHNDEWQYVTGASEEVLSVDHIGLEEVSALGGCATNRSRQQDRGRAPA
jgi:hypothetical protein